MNLAAWRIRERRPKAKEQNRRKERCIQDPQFKQIEHLNKDPKEKEV